MDPAEALGDLVSGGEDGAGLRVVGSLGVPLFLGDVSEEPYLKQRAVGNGGVPVSGGSWGSSQLN